MGKSSRHKKECEARGYSKVSLDLDIERVTAIAARMGAAAIDILPKKTSHENIAEVFAAFYDS